MGGGEGEAAEDGEGGGAWRARWLVARARVRADAASEPAAARADVLGTAMPQFSKVRTHRPGVSAWPCGVCNRRVFLTSSRARIHPAFALGRGARASRRVCIGGRAKGGAQRTWPDLNLLPQLQHTLQDGAARDAAAQVLHLLPRLVDVERADDDHLGLAREVPDGHRDGVGDVLGRHVDVVPQLRRDRDDG